MTQKESENAGGLANVKQKSANLWDVKSLSSL
jgi:hypothetical protein